MNKEANEILKLSPLFFAKIDKAKEEFGIIIAK